MADRGETMRFTLRAATTADIHALERLMAASARGLWQADYTEQQIEAALGSRMKVDREMICDGTFFVVEAGGEIVGCGGWSRRRTVFGADSRPECEPAVLDPAREVACIRDFFVHPDLARRGIGRRLLEHCEAAARAYGFTATELMATLTGQRLYQACGYVAGAPIREPLGEGLTIDLVPMRRKLT
jgi:GNAT superfamily N-acetyltransferase